MPTVSLVPSDGALRCDAVVVGVRPAPGGPVLARGAEPVDDALGGRIGAALRALGATGKADEVLKIPTLDRAPFPLLVATGLGATSPPDRDDGGEDQPDDEQVRRAVGAALRALGGTASVQLGLGDPARPGAAVEGALLGRYAFTAYKSEARAPSARRLQVRVDEPANREARAAVRRAQAVADAVLLTRDLVNAPANDLYPQTLAQRAVEVADAAGLDVEVLDEAELRQGGYGGLLGVGTGSARPPRLVRLRYRPARPRARVALVGKGITFDSGGLNLKPGEAMGWMKSDMGGAAAVLAAITAAARLRLPVEAVATLPLAENMVSGSAYRPSDVLTLRGGRTVEVTNTDAEGRLVLADAIMRAVEDDPDYLLETSTLTGGQVIALGTRVIGAMGDTAFRDAVVAAGAAAGESLWPMPIPDELRAGLDSPVADLVNLPADKWASMLVGAAFLREFVPEGLPWVHLDIAGPSWNAGAPWGYTPKGATGAGTRTLIATLERIAAG